MKISINWLKDFVDLKGISNEELIKRLTLSTAEIEEVIEYGKDLENVFVGQIKKVNSHPNSKKLTVLKVDIGNEILQIVCGASNCRYNMKVAVVVPGGMVEGHKIGIANLGGVESHGMCLSVRELGIGEDHDEIIELPQDFKVGTPIKDVLDIEDTIFEVDNKSLTNRPDLWCHYGFAREVAAIFNRKLKPLTGYSLESYNNLPKINIKIEDESKCYRYSGIKLNNIIKKQSPINMQIRLFYSGMRSLNLLADLTNYVMLEMGQPMHAFDSNKINEVVVKTPNKDLDFKTLDGEKRKIDTNTLLICEKDKPVAIAGIMGGLESEVKEDTTSILLESATFNAASTRKSAGKLGLRTEASQRYEKSLDPELTILALKRFVELLKNIDDQVTVSSSLTDVYPHKYPTLKINTTIKYIADYCGVKLTTQKVEEILTSLGFLVNTDGDKLKVTVPSYRATKDVSIPADLVEEVARIYGYDNIVAKAVEGKIEPVEQEAEHELEYEVKKLLAEKFDLNEVHTYIWNDVKANKELNIKTKGHIKVLNSTVKDNDSIRSELIPSLLKVINENKNTSSEMGIFEIGRVVNAIKKDGNVNEEKHMAIVLASKQTSKAELYFKLKDIIEFLNRTSNKENLTFSNDDSASNFLHPVNNTIVKGGNKIIAQMGILHPEVSLSIDKKLNIVAMEVNFKNFVEQKTKQKQVKQISKYQVTTLDFNFLADKDKCYFELETMLSSFESNLNYTIKLKNMFEDEKLLPNKKSYTFNFEIWANDHTLTSKEIDEFYSGLIKHAKHFGLELR